MFGLAAVVAGLAGVMYTPLLPPNYHLGMDFLVLSFVVVVVGGMGSLPGAVAAGFLLGILQSFASMTQVKAIIPGIDQIIIYLGRRRHLAGPPAWPAGPPRRDGGLSMDLFAMPRNDLICSFSASRSSCSPCRSGWPRSAPPIPDLLQTFVIYAIFAVGFNILFGLTGYLSFGHAAFLGVGSYTAVWSFKLLTHGRDAGDGLRGHRLRALRPGHRLCLSLRRSGIYFSILTLAFAQMSYNLAYSVLTPDHQWRNRRCS